MRGYSLVTSIKMESETFSIQNWTGLLVHILLLRSSHSLQHQIRFYTAIQNSTSTLSFAQIKNVFIQLSRRDKQMVTLGKSCHFQLDWSILSWSRPTNGLHSNVRLRVYFRIPPLCVLVSLVGVCNTARWPLHQSHQKRSHDFTVVQPILNKTFKTVYPDREKWFNKTCCILRWILKSQ